MQGINKRTCLKTFYSIKEVKTVQNYRLSNLEEMIIFDNEFISHQEIKY